MTFYSSSGTSHHILRMFTFFACAIANVSAAKENQSRVPFKVTECVGNDNNTLWNEVFPVTSVSSQTASREGFMVASTIQCAAVANSRKALGYLYVGGYCDLIGPEEGPSPLSAWWVGLDFPDALYKVEEVAMNKPVYSSPSVTGFSASMAVDGNAASLYMSQTGILNPWWTVDLGEVRVIHQVQIMPRTDCCWSDFHDVEIRVGSTLATNGDLSLHLLMFTYRGPHDSSQGLLICSAHGAMRGRYISIQKVSPTAGDLQLTDVKVFVQVK